MKPVEYSFTENHWEVAMGFWQELTKQAAGPMLSAVFLGGIAAEIARRAQRRKEYWSLRHELVKEMTETASELYSELLRYHRAINLYELTDNHKKMYRSQLDKQYRESRAGGQVIEDRLGAYFDSPQAKCKWHRAVDLLSMQYFTLIDEAPPLELLKKYTGPEHTGLTDHDDLLNLERLQKDYKGSHAEAAESVLTLKIRRCDGWWARRATD
jgi:hypothetical protein